VRVGVAGLWHETNTYSARRTELEDFEAFELLAGAAILQHHAGKGTVIGGILEGATTFEVVPVCTGGAWPAGRVAAGALESLLDRLERALAAAGRLDGLLLELHGAMVAEGVDDVEAETVRLVRRAIGNAPIAATLDLHGNPSPELAEGCDALIAYDTYPHVDMRERGLEAAELMADMLRGRRLGTLIRKVPLLSTPLGQATDAPPMRDLHELARTLASRPEIVRVSLLPGFPYADVERAGFSVLVTFERGRHEDAARVAAELVAEVEARADQFEVRRPLPEEAVERALAARHRPVVLADVADNVGGGSPGDGTVLLGELLARHATGAVVTLADAAAAREAAAAGPGGRLETAVGGKTDRRHGAPVPILGRVTRITDGRYRSRGTWMTGQEFALGTTAVVEVDGVTLVLTERAVPPFHAEQLESVGIEARDANIVVAKGAVAWRAAYGEIAGEVIEVDTPGICPLDPSVLERETIPMSV
jgi:microcystin degradation protein MlrC